MSNESKGVRALLITAEDILEVRLQADGGDSLLQAMQKAVGGLIEPFDVLFEGSPALYVNEEGLFTQRPNRAIFATARMAETGYVSQMDGRTAVREGQLYSIAYGDMLAVGFDPETGETVSITDEEAQRVREYFGEGASGPHSGEHAAFAIALQGLFGEGAVRDVL